MGKPHRRGLYRAALVGLLTLFLSAVVWYAVGEPPRRFIDSSAYLPHADDRFWAVNLWPHERYFRPGFLLQLLYAVLPSDPLRVAAQVTVFCLAWIAAVIFVIQGCMRPVTRLALAAVLLGFASLPIVGQWNTMLLGESLAISLAVLMLSATAVTPSGRAGLLAVVAGFSAGILLLFTRPYNVTVVPVVLVFAALRLVRPRLERNWAIGVASIVLITSAWSVVAVMRAETVTERAGGPAMNRSYYRGDERSWVAMERSAGRPECPVFDETSRQPEPEAVESEWRRYEAIKPVVRTSCPEFVEWLREGGLTPIAAMTRSPVVAASLFAGEAADTLSAPDYAGRATLADGVVRHPLAAIGFVALGFALRALDKRTLRLPARAWAIMIGGVVLTLGNAFLFWLSDPMEPARHALPWTLLLGPTLMAVVVVTPIRGSGVSASR